MDKKIIFSNIDFFLKEIAPHAKGSPEYNFIYDNYNSNIANLQDKLEMITPKSKCAAYGYNVDGNADNVTGNVSYPIEPNLAALITPTKPMELYLDGADVMLETYDQSYKLVTKMFIRDLQGQYFDRIKTDFEADGPNARSFKKTRSLRTIFNVTF
ncbi:MAG: hypothetical protein R3Y07_06885 [Eubacteriales bacterium]